MRPVLFTLICLILALPFVDGCVETMESQRYGTYTMSSSPRGYAPAYEIENTQQKSQSVRLFAIDTINEWMFVLNILIFIILTFFLFKIAR